MNPADRFSFNTATSPPPTGGEGADGQNAGEPAPNPMGPLWEHVQEAQRIARHYLQVRADEWKLRLHQTLLWGAFALLAGIVAVTSVVVAVVLAVVGLAGAMAAMLGDRLWAGELIVATLIFAALAVGARFAVRRITETSRKRTLEKYERQHTESRIARGEDIVERALGRPSERTGAV